MYIFSIFYHLGGPDGINIKINTHTYTQKLCLPLDVKRMKMYDIN